MSFKKNDNVVLINDSNLSGVESGDQFIVDDNYVSLYGYTGQRFESSRFIMERDNLFEVGDTVEVVKRQEVFIEWDEDGMMCETIGKKGKIESFNKERTTAYVEFEDNNWWSYDLACLTLIEKSIGTPLETTDAEELLGIRISELLAKKEELEQKIAEQMEIMKSINLLKSKGFKVIGNGSQP